MQHPAPHCKIITQRDPTMAPAYRWRAWAPAYCMYNVPTGNGPTERDAIAHVRLILGAPDEEVKR